MKRTGLFIIAGLIILSLLLFTCTYQVRFNEVAIVTTFRKITSVVNDQGNDAGLHFKWPYPIQQVTTYDSRVKILQTRLENIQTKDYQLIVAQVFLTWRIRDARVFYQRIESTSAADQRLDERLRSALGVFSEYNFYDLLTPDPKDNKLAAVESGIINLLAHPEGTTRGVLEAYGIEPVAVGISQFILPTKTATQVFERMKKTRERLATDTKSSGEAEAVRIVAKATSDAKTIQSFAERRAAAIRAQGDIEAAAYAAQLATNEGFAIYLEQLKALSAMIGQDTTIILPNDPPFNMLTQPPQAGQSQGGPNLNSGNNPGAAPSSPSSSSNPSTGQPAGSGLPGGGH